ERGAISTMGGLARSVRDGNRFSTPSDCCQSITRIWARNGVSPVLLRVSVCDCSPAAISIEIGAACRLPARVGPADSAPAASSSQHNAAHTGGVRTGVPSVRDGGGDGIGVVARDGGGVGSRQHL